MHKQEVNALVEHSEQSLKSSIWSVPIISWAFTGLSTALLIPTQVPYFIIGWGAILSVVSLKAQIASLKSYNNLRKNRALRLWDYLGTNGRLGYGLPMPPQTRAFGIKITELYERDPQGYLFPIQQAVQLIDTYHRQHKRLEQLSKRLNELKNLRSELKSRLERLAQLGDQHQVGVENLARFETDIAVLQKMRDQIEASCHRLEMLLISVQKAYEIRQLNAEITGLASHTSALILPENSQDETLANLEQQISHEIETFLQLERETDKHLG